MTGRTAVLGAITPTGRAILRIPDYDVIPSAHSNVTYIASDVGLTRSSGQI